MDEVPSQSAAVASFWRLHQSGCFVIPNPWDIGTAMALQNLGFKALATTSAGFAFTRGKPDGQVALDEMLTHIREIVQATPLPVNADFQAGYAEEPADVAINVERCIETGVAGLSIEDNSGRTGKPLYDRELAVDRIRAARSAIDSSGTNVVLTGRCEAWLVGERDPLATVLKRLVAYAEAGADCLYAPGVSAPEEISQIVKAVAPRPVNLLISGFNCRLSFLQVGDLGVRRISVGSGLALAAWGEFLRAARDIEKDGRFELLGRGAKTAAVTELFSKG
jgi:2-methylisocitrate lyase-like PEP mutase family enzyme